MSEMTIKQKKDLRKRFDDILIELEKADRWSIDMELGQRELSVEELIEKNLFEDGYAHREITGEITTTIKYYNEKRRRIV